MKYLAQDHTVSKWQSWASNPGCLALKSLFLTTILLCFTYVILFDRHKNPNLQIKHTQRG